MAYNSRKRKVKKNIPEGQAHIHSTYNNTVEIGRASCRERV